MFRVATEILISVFVAALLAVSCSDGVNKKAQTLYDNASEEFQRGEYDKTIALLNELDSLYADQINIRRQGMHLRPKVIEQQTIDRLNTVDSLLALYSWQCDSMSKSLRRVSNIVEGYFVSANSPADINSAPGLYARMAPDGMLYLIAVTPQCRANSISIESNGQSATSNTLPFDNERCAAYGSNCVLTFLHGEIPDIVNLLAKANGADFTVKYLNNGKVTGAKTISGNAASSISTICRLTLEINSAKLLEIEKRKLEKQLLTARNQVARTMPDSATTE